MKYPRSSWRVPKGDPDAWRARRVVSASLYGKYVWPVGDLAQAMGVTCSEVVQSAITLLVVELRRRGVDVTRGAKYGPVDMAGGLRKVLP